MDIFQTIIAVMADLDAIKKTKFNSTQKFHFRGIDDVYNALHPLCAKHGMFSMPTNIFEDKSEEKGTARGGLLIYRLFKVEYTFYASDGSFLKAIVPAEGMDTGDKATNKAMSAAHKYALLQVFCIPTEDMDDTDTTGEDAFPAEGKESDGPQYDQKPTEPEPSVSDQVGMALRFLESSNWAESKKAYFRNSIPKMADKELPVLIANLQKDGGR